MIEDGPSSSLGSLKVRLLEILVSFSVLSFFFSYIDSGALSSLLFFSSYCFGIVSILLNLIFDDENKEFYWTFILLFLAVFGAAISLIHAHYSLAFLTVLINIGFYRVLVHASIRWNLIAEICVFSIFLLALVDFLGLAEAPLVINHSENHISILCAFVLTIVLIARQKFPLIYLIPIIYLSIAATGRSNQGFAVAIAGLVLYQLAIGNRKVKFAVLLLFFSCLPLGIQNWDLIAAAGEILHEFDFSSDSRFQILTSVYSNLDLATLVIGSESSIYDNLGNVHLSSHNSFLSIFESLGIFGLLLIMVLFVFSGYCLYCSSHKVIVLFCLIVLMRSFLDNFLFTYGPVFGGLFIYLLTLSLRDNFRAEILRGRP